MKIKYVFSLLLVMLSLSATAMNQAQAAMLFAAMNVALAQAAVPQRAENLKLEEFKRKQNTKAWQNFPKHEKRSTSKGKFQRK